MGIQFNETSSTNTTSKIAFERLVKKVVHVHRDGKPLQTTNSILMTGEDDAGAGGMTGEKSIEDSREYFIKEKGRMNQDREAIERSTGTSFNHMTGTSFNPQNNTQTRFNEHSFKSTGIEFNAELKENQSKETIP